MKIWQRYLFRQIATVFLFILFSLFTVYLFIDLSVHSIRFFKAGYVASELTLYYVYSFSSLVDLFVPLAFLLASLKVLSDLTIHLELLSLQMARLSMKKILVPFFFLATLLTVVSYANHEWLAPKATVYLHTFKSNHISKNKTKHVQTTILADNSELVYHHLDRKKEELSDVFWIRSPTDIWHMKKLSFKTAPPTAYFADHLTAQEGKLMKSESFDQKSFDGLVLNGKLTPTKFHPVETRSLSKLLRESSIKSLDQPRIQTNLHYKLATPLLTFLILFAVAPFTLIHTRNRHTFLTVTLSLLAFIVVLILFDALTVLGVNKIIEPWIAMWIVPILICVGSVRRFAKV